MEGSTVMFLQSQRLLNLCWTRLVIKHRTIMEPSCGEGEFIIEIIRRLKQSSLTFGFNLNEAYHKSVFASDIDAVKIAVCTNRIKTEFPEIIHPEQNLFVEDYLLSSHKPVDIIMGNPPYIRYEETIEPTCMFLSSKNH